jgi:hypothetical protein
MHCTAYGNLARYRLESFWPPILRVRFSRPLRSRSTGAAETAVAEVLVKTDDLKHHPIRITYPTTTKDAWRSAVTVACQKDNKPKHTTWSVPEEMVDDGNPVIFMGAKRHANP